MAKKFKKDPRVTNIVRENDAENCRKTIKDLLTQIHPDEREEHFFHALFVHLKKLKHVEEVYPSVGRTFETMALYVLSELQERDFEIKNLTIFDRMMKAAKFESYHRQHDFFVKCMAFLANGPEQQIELVEYRNSLKNKKVIHLPRTVKMVANSSGAGIAGSRKKQELAHA